jgi:hypothetical protein
MKHLLSLLLLTLSVSLFAQIEKPITKGNVMIGGSAGFGISESVLSINLYPTAGFFVADGLVLGFSPSFYFSGEIGDNNYNNLGTGLGVFLSYYFKIGIYINWYTGYSLDHRYNTAYDYTNNRHNIGLGPSAGYALFLSENVALNFFIRETINIDISSGSTNGSSTSTLSYSEYIGSGFTIFL